MKLESAMCSLVLLAHSFVCACLANHRALERAGCTHGFGGSFCTFWQRNPRRILCCGAGQELRQSLQGFAARRSRAARSHAPLNTISGFRGSVALHHFRKWAQTAPPGAESANVIDIRTFRMLPPSTGAWKVLIQQHPPCTPKCPFVFGLALSGPFALRPYLLVC